MLSNARQRIFKKLNTIRLDPVRFDAIPLSQALETIKKDARIRDPEKSGINIILNTIADPQTAKPPAIDRATGLPMPGEERAEADISATMVTVNPELNDVTLGQVLDIIVKVADRPIKYSIEDYGVVFALRGAEPLDLHTRWFKVDPNTFLHGLKGVFGKDLSTSNTAAKHSVRSWLPGMGPGEGRQDQASIDFLTVQTPQEIVSSTVRAYFQAAGLTLDPPKSILFNDRLGMLMLRATQQDLDLIERVIQPDATRRHDRIEEAAQAVRAGGAGAETARTPSPAPKPLQSGSVDLRAAPPPELHTRWFKINPNTFMRAIQEVAAPQVDPATMRRIRSSDQSTADDVVAKIVIEQIRTYFQTAGVSLDPPKSIIFKDRLGMLMVRATLADLDLIEQAVQVLNTAPPQVLIEVKFCEVPEELLAAPGLKLQPTTTAMNEAGTNVASIALTSILTPERSRNVLRALEQKQDVTFLAAPNVITPNHRQAQLKTVEVKHIVTGLDLSTNAPAEPGKPPEHPPITEQFEFGPVVDVVPSVAADGRTITMTVIAGLKEFVGYDHDGAKDVWDYVESQGANPAPRRSFVTQKTPRPVFRERQAMARATLWDGQTLVLGGLISDQTTKMKAKVPVLGDLPFVGKLFRRESNAAKKKNLVIFVTPTIIDPAGNVVHTDADLPARANSVPTQLPPPRK
jgi:Flp pilus assembly secretin CpaC